MVTPLAALKEMTQQLVLRDKLLELIYERSSEGIIVADFDGLIQLANPAAHAIFEYVPNELEGMQVEQLVAPDMRDAHLAGMARYRQEPRARIFDPSYKLPGITKVGARVNLNVSLYPINDGVGPFILALVRLLERVSG